jgi:hypothetical protein
LSNKKIEVFGKVFCRGAMLSEHSLAVDDFDPLSTTQRNTWQAAEPAAKRKARVMSPGFKLIQTQ